MSWNCNCRRCLRTQCCTRNSSFCEVGLRFIQKFERTYPVKYDGVRKSGDFRLLGRYVSETVQDGTKVAIH